MTTAFADAAFWDEYDAVLRDFVGRPSPLYRCERYIAGVSAVPLLMKREDTNHTGAHKINNTVGQALLAMRMGKRRLLAETGAGQHGVATATVGAKFGLPVDVYMGARDVERQALNVHVMRLLGATVHAVSSGTQTLKDATNEAFRVWAERVDDTFYVIGSVVGAHPYPYWCASCRRWSASKRVAKCWSDIGRFRATSSPASAAAATRSASSPASWTIRGETLGRRGRRRRRRKRQEPRRRSASGASACCTARARICCRATKGKCCRPTRSAPGSIIPASGRSMRF